MVTTMSKGETDKKKGPSRERSRPAPGQARKGASLEKKLCWVAMAISGLLALLFGLDLAVEIPFSGASTALDVIVLISCVLLIYLSWDTMRELK